MGKHTDLLKGAKENDFTKILELFTNKQKKGLKSIFSKTKGKSTAPVWELTKDGAIRQMEKLTSIRIECRDELGNTPLILAALHGAVEVVECLIAYGANVNAQDSKGNSPLSLAAWSNERRAEVVVETLLKNGANPNLCNTENSGALHNACQTGRTYVLMMLLDAGADLHHKNAKGDAPLDIAARLDHREVVSFLIDHDQTVINSTKSLREAVMRGKSEVVQVLLDSGVDPGAQDPELGDSPLHIATRFYRAELCKMLLAFGADAYLKNKKDETPLSIVDQYPDSHKHKALIKQLIDEFKDKEIITPAIEQDKRSQRRAKEAIKNTTGQPAWPIIKPMTAWIDPAKTQLYSVSDAKYPLMNILDGNANTQWRAEGAGRQFVVFDMSSPFTVTKIVLSGQKTKMMPKDFQLETAPSADGPWRIIVGGETAAESVLSGTFESTVEGFVATSRFWKLQILRNHGAPETRLGGISFFGVDHMLKKFFTENGFVQYFDDFITLGVNQIGALKTVDMEKVKEIVPLAGHLRKVQLAVDRLKGSVVVKFDRLVFAAQPPEEVLIGQEIEPAIEVLAVPGISEEVELIVHGENGNDVVVEGITKLKLNPNGKSPSSAKFSDIIISTEGEYTIEVRSVKDKVSVRSDRSLFVVAPRSKDAIEALFMDFENLISIFK